MVYFSDMVDFLYLCSLIELVWARNMGITTVERIIFSLMEVMAIVSLLCQAFQVQNFLPVNRFFRSDVVVPVISLQLLVQSNRVYYPSVIKCGN